VLEVMELCSSSPLAAPKFSVELKPEKKTLYFKYIKIVTLI
jgi:hypothetical protein